MTGFWEERGAQNISAISTEAGRRLTQGSPNCRVIDSLLQKEKRGRRGEGKPHSAASKINPKAVLTNRNLTKHTAPVFRECAERWGPHSKYRQLNKGREGATRNPFSPLVKVFFIEFSFFIMPSKLSKKTTGQLTSQHELYARGIKKKQK